MLLRTCNPREHVTGCLLETQSILHYSLSELLSDDSNGSSIGKRRIAAIPVSYASRLSDETHIVQLLS